MVHRIFQKTADIPTNDWEQVLGDANLYLSLVYLHVLETTLNDEVLLYFSISYTNDKPVLIASFQLVTFIDKREQSHTSILKIFSDTKSKKQPFKMNMLVCGNVFSDGENGFAYDNSIDKNEIVTALNTVSKVVKKRFRKQQKISVRLFKEFWPASVSMMDVLLAYRFKDFKIDVNMVLDIHPSWRTFDDYLQSMKTKFRTKANSAYTKSKDVEVRFLNASEILQYQETIDTLFTNVLDKSEYSFGRMNAQVFASLKASLQDAFTFSALFLDSKMVGFSTAYFHKGIMEAGYVGLDYTYNFTNAIYQRILYHYVEQAIDKKVSQLQLGRTSELIKSALGARPVDMKLYAKHKRPVTNLIMGAVLTKVTPSDYALRRPFKSGFEI